MATPFPTDLRAPLTSGSITSTGTPGSGVGQLNVGGDELARRAAANARPPMGAGFEVPLQEAPGTLPVQPQQQLENPPASEEERTVRKTAWIDLLNSAIADPDASQALLFLGAQLLAPRTGGESQAGRLSSSLSGASEFFTKKKAARGAAQQAGIVEERTAKQAAATLKKTEAETAKLKREAKLVGSKASDKKDLISALVKTGAAPDIATATVMVGKGLSKTKQKFITEAMGRAIANDTFGDLTDIVLLDMRNKLATVFDDEIGAKVAAAAAEEEELVPKEEKSLLQKGLDLIGLGGEEPELTFEEASLTLPALTQASFDKLMAKEEGRKRLNAALGK